MREERREIAHAQQPDPQYRAWLCGPFRLEQRVGESDEAVERRAWGGHASPRTLLKALLCAPGRQMRRSSLVAQLWPDASEAQAHREMSVALTLLRRVLRGNEGEEVLIEEGTTGIRLAGQAVLWVDADAASLLLTRVEQIGKHSPEALPLLEEALRYFDRGTFLGDDEGEWVMARRALIERQHYRCRLRVADLYGQQGCVERAESVLNDLLRDDPFDEDVICRLMLLLHQQGLTHQAMRVYQQASALFAEDGLELTEATRELATRLVREPQILPMGSPAPGEKQTQIPSTLSVVNEAHQLILLLNKQPSGQSKRESDQPEDMDMLRRQLLEASIHTAEIVPLLPFAELFDNDLFERFSRALMKPQRLDEETFLYLETCTKQLWLNRQSAIFSSRDLYRPVNTHLQKMIALLERSLLPTERLRLCGLLSQTAQLLGELSLDLGYYARGKTFHQAALAAAQEAEDGFLMAVSWGRVSLACIYHQAYPDALRAIQAAQSLAHTSSTPMIQRWLAAIEAEIQAHLTQANLCLQALERAECFDDPHSSPLEDYLVRFDRSLLGGYQGVCFRLLSHPEHNQSACFLQKAQQSLGAALASLDSLFLQRKPTLLADLAAVRIYQQDVEEACALMDQAVTLAAQLRLHKVTQRLLALQEPLKPWKDLAPVKALDARLAFLSSQH